ncbi:MAG: DUF4340 domain-containing protein [Polyangiaceae bacterium]|nr:DUF4340 domain-containing protein [Polyangiaceae bacterium]
MSRDKLIIFGVVLLGLLGVLVYRQMKTDEAIGAPQTSAMELPTISAPDDVDKLDITNGEKGEVVLERVPDPSAPATDAGAATKWVMTKPVAADANQTVVKDLLTNLKDLKVDRKVELKVDDNLKKDKQLDAAHGLHILASKGGIKKIDETFGKSGQVGTLVMVEEKPGAVWAAKGYSSFLYAKEPKDFREKSILKFEDANVTSFEITNSHGVSTFKRDGDKWTATESKKPVAHLDPDKVKSMLGVFKNLNADDFGDGKPLAATGLDKPEAQVTFQMKDDPNGSYTLFVGTAGSGTDRYAKRQDRDVVYQIAGYAQEWITSDISKYEASGDAGAPASKAKAEAKADVHKK